MLARTRLYAEPNGKLHSLIGAASGDLSSALTELMTRNDFFLQIREAEVHVELVSEPGFAQVAAVSADSVAPLGSTLAVSASLRVGRRADREIGLELALPDTIPPGIYLGSKSPRQPPSGKTPPKRISDCSESWPGGWDWGISETKETLEEVFARLNKPQKNLVLKARLTFSAPPGSPETPGEDFELLGDLFGDLNGPQPSVSTEEEVGLYISGSQEVEIELTGE